MPIASAHFRSLYARTCCLPADSDTVPIMTWRGGDMHSAESLLVIIFVIIMAVVCAWDAFLCHIASFYLDFFIWPSCHHFFVYMLYDTL